MFGRAEFRLTEDYYRDFYDEWYRCACRWRKIQLPMAVATACIAIPLWMSGRTSSAIVVGAFAAVQLSDSLLHRRRWLHQRTSSSRLGESVSLEFMNEGIEISGPFSVGRMGWAAFSSCDRTDKGIFLRPDTGLSIYVPPGCRNSTGGDRANSDARRAERRRSGP